MQQREWLTPVCSGVDLPPTTIEPFAVPGVDAVAESAMKSRDDASVSLNRVDGPERSRRDGPELSRGDGEEPVSERSESKESRASHSEILR